MAVIDPGRAAAGRIPAHKRIGNFESWRLCAATRRKTELITESYAKITYAIGTGKQIVRTGIQLAKNNENGEFTAKSESTFGAADSIEARHASGVGTPCT
jgi:hypothetical protein